MSFVIGQITHPKYENQLAILVKKIDNVSPLFVYV